MDRNKAIGIEEDNQFSTYLRLAGRQIIRTRESLNLWLLQLLNSQLVNIRDQTKNLIAAAKTPDEKRKVLPMVEGLLEQAEVISKEMDRLTNG